MTTNTISGGVIHERKPLWPVLVAPAVGGLYYLSIKLAFAESIVSVLGRTDFFDLATHDGAHIGYTEPPPK